MDNKKILIVNLSKGRIGEQNTNLLGSMIITKIYIAAMSRADVSHSRMLEIPPFYFYVDEFQSFANESFANILSEARKYKLALIIAHQYIAQMEESVRDAVFGNVGTSISFRVGPLDAELLEKVYAPQFTATDLINLGMAQVYLSLMINDIGSPPFSAKTLFPIARPDISYRNDVIEWTRSNFASPKDVVAENIKEWFGKDDSQQFVNKKPYIPKTNQVESKTYNNKENNFYKKEEPKSHTPFKKVFDNKQSDKTTNINLNNLYKEKKEPLLKKDNSFKEEKKLSESIAPVKLAERGPTESNRNLLREALLKASKTESLEKNIPLPEIKDLKNKVIDDKSVIKEISHNDLQKILE